MSYDWYQYHGETHEVTVQVIPAPPGMEVRHGMGNDDDDDGTPLYGAEPCYFFLLQESRWVTVDDGPGQPGRRIDLQPPYETNVVPAMMSDLSTPTWVESAEKCGDFLGVFPVGSPMPGYRRFVVDAQRVQS